MKKLLLTFLLLSTSFLSFAISDPDTSSSLVEGIVEDTFYSDEEVSVTMEGYTGTSENINFAFGLVDFSSISLDFLSYVLNGIYVGLGLGLALFAMRLVYKFFKSFSKGSSTSKGSSKK